MRKIILVLVALSLHIVGTTIGKEWRSEELDHQLKTTLKNSKSSCLISPKETYRDAWLNRGHFWHFSQLFGCSNRTMRVLTFGGSIEQGHGLRSGEKPWPLLLKFGTCKVSVENHAYAAAGTTYALVKVDDYLSGEKFDLVIVGFASNDINVGKFYSGDKMQLFKATEKFIRTVVYEHGTPLIYLESWGNMRGGDITTYADRWRNSFFTGEDEHSILLKYYNIPSISIRNALWPIRFTEDSPDYALFADGIHPSQEGHKLWANILEVSVLEELEFLKMYIGSDSTVSVPPTLPPLFLTKREAKEIKTDCVFDWNAGAGEPSSADNWSWINDQKAGREPKFGWISNGEEENMLNFEYKNSFHKVTIGYLATYENIGSVDVDVGTSTHVTIDALWTQRVSIFQMREIEVTSAQGSLVSFVNRSGKKFKLLSLCFLS